MDNNTEDKTVIEDFHKAIRVVENWPKDKITFRDFSPVFTDCDLTARILNHMAKNLEKTEFDAIAGLETRGYLFGLLLSQKLKKPFVVVRKAGKLPPPTHKIKYSLEYGSAEFEVVEGAFQKGWKVLVHDDLLATGGSALAAAQLVLDSGATVAGYQFLISLKGANGTKKIEEKIPAPVFTLLEYD
jgi:adenine phosphoribosyltransferase